MRKATKTVATWLGIVAGIGGLEHGYFEFTRSHFHGTPMGDPSSYGKTFGWAGYQCMWLEK